MDGITINLDLNRLSRAEQIWLWRRRQQNTTGRVRGRGGACMSINEAAALLNLPVSVYIAAENGNEDHVGRVLEEIKKFNSSTRTTQGERCQLARRRTGATVEELCQALSGISKPTFYSREALGHPDIVALWQARGYTF
jgi:hypothetical protein